MSYFRRAARVFAVVFGLFTLVHAGPVAAQANTIEVRGIEYTITEVTDTLGGALDELRDQPWWGDSALSKDFGDAYRPYVTSYVHFAYAWNNVAVSVYYVQPHTAQFASFAPGTNPRIWAVQATAVPEINGPALAQVGVILLALVLALTTLRRRRTQG